MPNDDISMNSLHNGKRRNAPHEFACPTSTRILYTICVGKRTKTPTAPVSLGLISMSSFLDTIQNTPNEKEEFIVVGLVSTLVAVELPSVTPRVDISYTALEVLRLSAVISWTS